MKTLKIITDFLIWPFTIVFQLIKRTLSTVLFFFSAWYSIIVFSVFNRVSIVGRKNIPRTTKVLYVANHETFIDSFLIGLAIMNIQDFIFNYRRIPWNAAASEFFFNNSLKKFLFSLLKCRPTIRKTTSRSSLEKSVKEMAAILTKENLVLFFEGGRTRTGEINDCKPGVPLIIRLADPIVIPIFLDGVEPILPVDVGFKLFNIKRGHRVGVIIGKPIDFSDIPKLSFDGNSAIHSKGPLPKEIYDKTAIDIIKRRVEEAVKSLDPKRK